MSRRLFMLLYLPRQAVDDHPHLHPSCCLIQSGAVTARCQEIASKGKDASGKFDPPRSPSKKRNFHPQSRQVVREGGKGHIPAESEKSNLRDS